MKYVISELGEVETGGMFHQDMARDFKGKVVAAGHYDLKDGTLRVFGRSIGFDLDAQSMDAVILMRHLKHENTIS